MAKRTERRRSFGRRQTDRLLVELTRATNLLVKLMALSFLLQLWIANEVWEFIDVDIEAGATLEAYSWQQFGAHFQAVAAGLIAIAGISLSIRQILTNWRFIKLPDGAPAKESKP